MMTELNATDRARVRAQVIDAGLAVALAAHVAGAPRAELRQAVATFVADAKRTMTPPQDVIASLKAHVQGDAAPHPNAAEYAQVVQLAVGWASDDYYQA